MRDKHRLADNKLQHRMESLRPRLFGYALPRLHHRIQDAEDSVQSTFTTVLDRLDDLRASQSFEAWVFAIHRTTIALMGRKRRHDRRLDNSSSESATEPAAPDERARREREQHAMDLLARIGEQLPPVLAKHLHAVIDPVQEQDSDQGRAGALGHKARRDQERLKEWVWKRIGLATTRAFLDSVEEFIDNPSPKASAAMVAIAQDGGQAAFAHVILVAFHLGTAEALLRSLTWHSAGRIEKSSSIAVASAVLAHSELALTSAEAVDSMYLQGAAHDLASRALLARLKIAECGSSPMQRAELVSGLQACADKNGTAAICFSRSGELGAMTVSRLRQAIILKNIGGLTQSHQVLAEGREACRLQGYKPGEAALGREGQELSRFVASDQETGVV